MPQNKCISVNQSRKKNTNVKYSKKNKTKKKSELGVIALAYVCVYLDIEVVGIMGPFLMLFSMNSASLGSILQLGQEGK